MATPTRPPGQKDVLFDAIKSATLKRTQTVLQEICTESSEAFDLACKKLLVNESDIEVDPEAEGKAGKKRKRDAMQQRYEICVQCEQEYDVSENWDEACRFHPGMNNVDSGDECSC
jgi:hypothetical protein